MRYLPFLLTLSAFGQSVDWNNQLKNKPFFESTAYQWFRTSGAGASGNLSATGSKTITVTPCPLGLSSSDYYFRIYDGTGTAEAVLRTGGTCTSGAASGTLVGTTVNTHTGSWKVGTATAGIQEAVNAAVPPGDDRKASVSIPAGVHTLYAPIYYGGDYLDISGYGRASTFLYQTNPTANVFTFGGAEGIYNTVRNLGINAGSGLQTAGWAIDATNQYEFTAKELSIVNMANGIKLFDCAAIYVSNTSIRQLKPATGVGVYIDGTTTGRDGYWLDRLIIESLGSESLAGIMILTGGGVYLTKSDVLSVGTGILIGPATGQEVRWVFVSNTSIDTNANNGIAISPTGGTVKSIQIADAWSSSNEESGLFIGGTGTIDGVSVRGSRLFNNGLSGIIVASPAINVDIGEGSRICGNSTVTPANGHGVYISPGVSRWSVTNSRIGSCETFTNTQGYGVFVDAGASNHYRVAGNDLSDNATGTLQDSGAGTDKTISNNIPDVPTTLSTVLYTFTTRNVSIGSGTDTGQKFHVDGGIQALTDTVKPACDVNSRGTFWHVKGGLGIKDSVEVCAKDSGNSFAWRTIY